MTAKIFLAIREIETLRLCRKFAACDLWQSQEIRFCVEGGTNTEKVVDKAHKKIVHVIKMPEDEGC